MNLIQHHGSRKDYLIMICKLRIVCNAFQAKEETILDQQEAEK